VPEQHDLPNVRLLLQELDAALDVEGDELPDDGGLVVVEPRVHRQHEKAPLRELARGEMPEIVVDPVDEEHADAGAAGVRPIERALDGKRIELDVDRRGLRERGPMNPECPDQDEHDTSQHRRAPHLIRAVAVNRR
jgi:hypothetical protein